MSQPLLQDVLPSILTLKTHARGRDWLLRCSEDLGEVVRRSDADEVSLSVQVALHAALIAPGRGCWRTSIDIGSHLFSVVVNEEAGWILLGSPRFSAEASILHAVRHRGETADSGARVQRALSDLEALVAGYRTARDDNSPLVIETLIARHNLPDVLHPQGEFARQHEELNRRIAVRVAAIEPDLRAYRPTTLERISQWGLDLNARYAILRVHALRFVAALPALDHDRKGGEVVRLLREMLRRIVEDSGLARRNERTGDRQPVPKGLENLCRIANFMVPLFPVAWVAWGTRRAVRMLARIFIAGESMETAWPALQGLADSGRDATVDQLGELVVSEAEADVYCDRVLALVRGLGERHGASQPKNRAGVERANVSVKVSALCSDFNPDDPEGTWQRVGPRLERIMLEARRLGVFINLDAEHLHVRDLNFLMLRRVLSHPDLRRHTGVGLAIQAYLRDAPEHLDAVTGFCRQRGVRMPIRLVKGAYWDAETTEADAHGFCAPEFLNKAESDAMFQMLVLRILACHDAVQLCIGSHNLRDHCFAHEARELMYPGAPPVEHQALHMTYEGLSTALAKQGWAVRNYIPVGSLLVGMAYLVRRILENSSQVGVLTMARAGVDLQLGLTPPTRVLHVAMEQGEITRDPLNVADPPGEMPPFRNCGPARLYLAPHRAAFDEAIAMRRLLLPFREDATAVDVRSGPMTVVRSPSDTDDVLGHIGFCTAADVDMAVTEALAQQPQWAARSVGQRATLVIRAAERMRVRRLDFAAVAALEGGKARNEALADVDEAIDFMMFYAREAFRVETSWPEAKPWGVVAVVAPWNFPLAIPCGMAIAALVAGNAVLLKSARPTPLIVELLVRLLREVGVPPTVFRHMTGPGSEVGNRLVQHPDVSASVFTGSVGVGSWIYSAMAPQAVDGRTKRAITEMGGKNAVIVTASADLDEAVSGCLYSAFGHAGQKCSAASRILVDERILPAFLARFRRAANDLQLGPAASHGTRVNPVISAQEQARLRKDAAAAGQEARDNGGEVVVDRSQQSAPGPMPAQPEPGRAFAGTPRGGHLVGPTVVLLPADAAVKPDSYAQRELFGPIVHIIPTKSMEHAVELFNGTDFALTGGMFTQSQDDIARLGDLLECGNVYVNRTVTGARVGIEPFGGFKLSGTGPKAGGREYLPSFYSLLAPSPLSRGPMDPQGAAILNDMENPETPSVDDDELPLASHDHVGHEHGPAPKVTSVVKGLQLAAAMKRALETVPKGMLDPESRAHVEALLAWMLQQLPGLASGAELNRVVPGQDSFNRWSLPRGPAVVLAGRRVPGGNAVVHAVAAACTGNPVEVLACSAESHVAWQGLAQQLAGVDEPPAFDVVRVVDGDGILAALGRLHVTTVVLDGTAEEWEPVLAAATALPKGQRHVRAVHCAVSWPQAPDYEGVAKAHLHCRSFAVHTMRHGAPLSL
jgi:RHH-type proline utilization regulon transcriptional repressor/proline dehydrogenase/delta 1-pyrroline-5-carboxylate dehydrogenase